MDWLSFFKSWIAGFLSRLGLINREAKVLLLGLDNAGKTTLLFLLKEGSIKSFVPTERAHMEEIMIGKINFKAWDLGGHERVRTLWQDFYAEADAIVFMVDSADQERFEESKLELDALLSAPGLTDVPVVVLANKSDVKWAATRDQVIGALGLQNLIDSPMSDDKKRPLQVYRCSLVDGTGYKDAFEYLASHL